jgi:hypothetical protein
MNCGDEECMTEKTEAKEFAYFSGITTGRNGERERIIKLFENEQYRYGQAFVDHIIQIIKGQKR